MSAINYHERINLIFQFQTTVGQVETGFAIDLKAESEEKLLDWATSKYDLSSILFSLHDDTISNNNFTATYNPRESTAKYVKLFFTYEDRSIKTGETAEIIGNGAIPMSTTPANEQRQKEFLRKVAAGIKGNCFEFRS